MAYDYADNPTTENRTHTNGVTAQNYNQRRVYDELARLHDYNVSIAGVENLAARYEYNYRNELRERDQHWGGSNWLQKIDYLYNDQGWLTQINGNNLTGTNIAFPTCTTSVVNPGVTTVGQDMDQKDLFYMQLQYDNLFSGVTGSLRKDGNISQAIWRVRGRERQAYSYAYDGLQRISTASYSDISDAGIVTVSGRYNTSYTYADLRGNISTNVRNGLYLSGACYTQATLDNMTYSYTAGSNKISSIADAALAAQGGFRASSGAFTYDVNGNMISNAAKSITSITYNHLNLPINITLSGSRTIDFTYTADGIKLKKVVKTGAIVNLTQDYVSGIEYKNSVIEGIYHAEGRLYNNSGTWMREYTIKDHLGDTRIAYCDINNDGVIATPSEILQENHFDAFGYGLEGVYMNHSNPDNLYQYNGKELNNDHGIGLIDFGKRFYDPSMARFIGCDPISEKFPFATTYNYAENEPVSNIDLWGLQKFKASDGSIINGPFRNQDEANKASRAAQGLSAYGSYVGIRTQQVRAEYNIKTSSLDASDTKGRTLAKIEAREKLPAITNAFSEKLSPIENESSKISGTANKTNVKITGDANILGNAGKVMGAAAIGLSIYNIATSDDKPKAMATETGALAGGIVLGELGASGGAALGFTIGGPAGALIGSIVFGVAGSVGGSLWGAEIGNKVYKSATQSKEPQKQ